MDFKKLALKFLLSFVITFIILAALSFNFLVSQEIIVFLGISIVLSLVAGVLGMLIPSENLKKNYAFILIPVNIVVFLFFFMYASF